MTRTARAHRPMVRRRGGFTTVELIIAFTLLTVVSAAAVSMLLNTARGMRTQREITATEDGLRAFQQTVNVVLRAAAANPGGMTGSASSVPRLEGVTGTATSCSRIRVVSDLNGDKNVSGSMEDVELYLQGQAVLGRWSAGATVDTLVFPASALTFAVQTAAGGAVACATSMSTARRVQVTIEAPRRSGSTQVVRRQWTVELRNFQ